MNYNLKIIINEEIKKICAFNIIFLNNILQQANNEFFFDIILI